MNPLRQLRLVSTRRLLAVLAGVAVLVGGVATAAVAALGGSGPIPAASTLAAAIHDALAGPRIAGVTAQIQFTDNLVDASSVPDAGPLLTGASGRFWADGNGDMRLELQASSGDTEITVTPGSFQVYDVASNTVYRGTLPADKSTHAGGHGDQPPTLETITDTLDKLMGRLDISGATPTDVGGAPAYAVRVAPKHDGGLLGSAELAFDAANGAPLQFAVYAQGDTSPVIELTATQISFGAVAPSDVTVTPPSDAKIVAVSLPTPSPAAAHSLTKTKPVTGAPAVAAALPFTLDAPAELAGLPQTSVRLVSFGGDAAALVAYGQHLGGILVLERKAATTSAATPPAPSSSGSSSGLPTVTINGATGTELATALGTLIRFASNGVTYTVVGSVPPAAAEAAARGL
jgi:hypothetical protein